MVGDEVIDNRLLVIGDSIMASTATRYSGLMCDELVPLGWAVEVEAEPSRFIDFGNRVLDQTLDPMRRHRGRLGCRGRLPREQLRP